MYNFINKTVNSEFVQRSQTLASQDIIFSQKISRQQNATQCLLYLSEIENQQNKEYNLHKDIFQTAQVTPWQNIKLKLNTQTCYARSKTSMILPPCGRSQNTKQNKIFQKIKHDKQNKQNISSKERLTKMGKQFSTNKKKNSSEIKSSYSTIARYSQNIYDRKQRQLHELSQVKQSNCSSIVYINCEQNQNEKKKIQPNKKQIEPIKIILTIPKIGDRQNKKINTLNDQIFYPILRQNKSKFIKAPVQNNCEELKKKKNEIKQFNLKQDDQKIYDQSKYKQANKQTNFTKIKNSILQRIQKQSVVCLSVMADNKNPRKKLKFKYLRKSHDKNPKDIKKNQNINHSYQANNPITKQLYQKYKKLLNSYE